jgi:hypothetical protein
MHLLFMMGIPGHATDPVALAQPQPTFGEDAL